jgi:hypothetical protein
LTSFPAGIFDGCISINFSGAFIDCALTEQSVDNILISIESNGTSDGRIDITGGTNQAPGAAGRSAQIALQARGWTVNLASAVSGIAAASAVSNISANGNDVTPLMPFIEEAFSFLDAYKLLSDGFRTDDAVETWDNALALSDGDANQTTVAARAIFQTNANSTGVPGLFFQGTQEHYELGNAWRLPKQGPWTMYFVLRRNAIASRAINSWSDAANINTSAYQNSLISAARTNYDTNGVFSGNLLEHVNTCPVYSFVNGQRRVLSISKRLNGGYSVYIDNLLLYQTNADNPNTLTPIKQPLLGARWNSTGLEKEIFSISTMMSVMGFNSYHDASKINEVNNFLFNRYAVTPPHIENRNTNIANVTASNARGNWINDDTTTTMFDLSSYGKNGIYQNGVQLQQNPLAKDGQSALFTAASNHYVSDIGSIGDYNFMRSTHQWTFGAWIRPVAGLSNYQLLLSTTTSESEVGVWIGLDKTGTNRQMRVDLCGPSGEVQLNIRSFASLWVNNRTSFITVTSDGSNIRFYKDGALWGLASITAGTSSSNHDQALSFAGPQQGYFNGSMQLAFIANRALTQNEIIDVYASTRLEF